MLDLKECPPYEGDAKKRKTIMPFQLHSCVRIKDIISKPMGRICRIIPGDAFPYCVVFQNQGGQDETRRAEESLELVEPCPVDWPISEGQCAGHCVVSMLEAVSMPPRPARKKAAPKKKAVKKAAKKRPAKKSPAKKAPRKKVSGKKPASKKSAIKVLPRKKSISKKRTSKKPSKKR
jgi:hypothetical protein